MVVPEAWRLAGSWLALVGLLAVAALVRLYHVGSPLADGPQAKQIFVANRARGIARPPFNPLRNSLDFLDQDGRRLELTEEVPVYMSLLALGYRMFGEKEWVGHTLSLIGMLVAVVALHDLVLRGWGRSPALAATALFVASPLSIFLGRAVMPESWMLAGMLTSAACYQRFLAGGRQRWLLGAAVAGLGGALFKYYGLLVLVPLAEMTVRRRGWRACLGWRFLGLTTALIVPVAAWMVLVFARTTNPVTSGWVPGQPVYPYVVWQAPGVLCDPLLFRAFFRRFLFEDCGPISAILLLVGVAAALKRRALPGLIGGWTVMSLGFFLAFAPKFIDHDYYELVMLPCAAAWGALGFSVLVPGFAGASLPRRCVLGAGVLGLALLVQSPWFMGSLFELEWGKPIAAAQLARVVPRSGRVVAMGPGTGLRVIVHYSGHEGWPVQRSTLAADWRSEFAHYRDQGGTHVAVYFGARATAVQRDSYKPLIACCPIVARRAGPRSGPGLGGDYVILDLRAADLAGDRDPALVSGRDGCSRLD
jgi:hypothetical protein